MRLSLILVVSTILAEAYSFEFCPGNETSTFISNRRKRALNFPKGSAFVLTITLLKAIQVRVPSNWNLDLEFDMIWPIPNGYESKMRNHRRHRRELYANFELTLDSQGFPGNQCILRTICEGKFMLNPPGVSLIEDLLRVVFRYPKTRMNYDVYDAAYATKENCDVAYPCPFSILDLLLHYNNDLSSYR